MPLDSNLHPGHTLHWLLDAHTAWRAHVDAIDGAKHHILGQLYMLQPDAAGDALVDALARASRRGVVVQLVLDALGSHDTSPTQLAALTDAGVALRLFGQPRIGQNPNRWRRRNHRKVWVVDGELALVGGRNVGAEYFALQPGDPTWHDAGVAVRGPLVHQLAEVLHADWRRLGRRSAVGPERAHHRQTHHWLPPPHAATDLQLGVALNRGAIRSAFANRAYVQAVRAATTSIALAHAYFLPGRQLHGALMAACKRGVAVRVLLPGLATNDIAAVGWATLHGLGRLLGKGAQVRMVTDTMLHAKLGMVDGQWWTVGSCNLDALSRRRNLEANVVGVGQAEPLYDYFETLWQRGQPWTTADNAVRSLGLRILGWMAWQMRGLL